MKQTAFSDAEFTNKKEQTDRDRFLAEIESVTRWPALVAALQPHYPKGEARGRPPVGLERMLRSSALVCRTKASRMRSMTARPFAALSVST